MRPPVHQSKRLVPLLGTRRVPRGTTPLGGPSRAPPTRGRPTQPSAVTGGPVRVYCARLAATRFGRRLGEDLLRAGPPGSHRPRLAWAQDPGYSVPSSPFGGIVAAQRRGFGIPRSSGLERGEVPARG